jgi:hypothetical protein
MTQKSKILTPRLRRPSRSHLVKDGGRKSSPAPIQLTLPISGRFIRNCPGKALVPPPNQPISFKGKMHTKAPDIARNFCSLFTKTVKHKSDPRTRKVRRSLLKKHKLDRSFAPLTPLATRDAINSAKSSTATGPDGLTAIHLKHLGPQEASLTSQACSTYQLVTPTYLQCGKRLSSCRFSNQENLLIWGGLIVQSLFSALQQRCLSVCYFLLLPMPYQKAAFNTGSPPNIPALQPYFQSSPVLRLASTTLNPLVVLLSAPWTSARCFTA